MTTQQQPLWMKATIGLLLTVGFARSAAAAAGAATGMTGGEISWALNYDPKTLDPAKVDDQVSEQVRYLTGGVLLRLNRSTQEIEPALAQSWSVSPDGKLVTFHLRQGLRFSDGSSLTSADVAYTLKRVLASATGAPVADEFVSPAKVQIDAPDAATVRVHLPEWIVAIGNVFDEIAVEPANRETDEHVTAGPFFVSEYRRGESLQLARNPYYFKHDVTGAALPYLGSIRLDILNNRETEELRFARGQYSLLDSVPADTAEALNRRVPGSVHDLGPSLNTEQMWFNQASSAPLPAYEKAWFTDRMFRNAISLALHRDDLVRIAYNGHATPANGYISPANTTWYNRTLSRPAADPAAALRLLSQAGFHKDGNQLMDRSGHPVKFSILTNAGNRSRARMASLIQQDLGALGIPVNVVTLDFPALIERLMHTQDYEAALLGLADVQPDPSSSMNVWLSSSPNHQWNPSEKAPATPWEAEIDRLVHTQAESGDARVRKAAVDRLQAIVSEQQPFIYLVYPNVLCAASPSLEGIRLTVLQPDVVSEIDKVRLRGNPR
jgi:peptide/nickel transport system substrate-binding protein